VALLPAACRFLSMDLGASDVVSPTFSRLPMQLLRGVALLWCTHDQYIRRVGCGWFVRGTLSDALRDESS
jgi:hypothetical protein